MKKSALLLLSSLSLLLASFESQANTGEQLFIPIGVGDITTFIPVLGAPSSVTVVEDTQPIGESIHQVSWSAVGNATYYQINVTDENGQITSFTTTDLDYDLSGLPLGTSTVQLLACNSNDQCGAATDLGTYTVNERIRYAYADVLGSPILETDQAGNAIAEFHYKPFGETEEEKQEDIGYTGHLEDTDLALTYMQARYYDPVIGRFYGNDPVGFTGDLTTFNRYSYVGNNPYSYTDPDGKNRKGRRNQGYAVTAITARFIQRVTEPGSAIHNYAAVVEDVANTAMSGRSGRGSSSKTQEKQDGNVTDSGATNNATKVKLNKELKSQEQIDELNSGTAERIAGSGTNKELTDAPRLADEYGGDTGDYAKIRSSNHTHTDGFNQETHAYQNTTTGQIVEYKSKIEGH